MNRPRESDLIRLLHGELPPERAREVEGELARDPELARAYARLAATWSALELPPTAPAPRGFARAVASRASGAGLWRGAPTAVRVGAAVALAAGLALGVGVGFAGRDLLAGSAANDRAANDVDPSTQVARVAPGTVPVDAPAPSAAAPESGPTPRATAGAAEPGMPSSGARNVPSAPSAPGAPSGSTAPNPPTAVDGLAGLEFDTLADAGGLADGYWQAFDLSAAGAASSEGL